MRIEKGKRYITRNGLITEPLRIANNGTAYKLESWINEPQHMTPTACSWKDNGRAVADNIDHGHDIIAEYQQPITNQ